MLEKYIGLCQINLSTKEKTMTPERFEEIDAIVDEWWEEQTPMGFEDPQEALQANPSLLVEATNNQVSLQEVIEWNQEWTRLFDEECLEYEEDLDEYSPEE